MLALDSIACLYRQADRYSDPAFVEYDTEPQLGTREYLQIRIFFPSVVNPGGLQGEELGLKAGQRRLWM